MSINHGLESQHRIVLYHIQKGHQLGWVGVVEMSSEDNWRNLKLQGWTEAEILNDHLKEVHLPTLRELQVKKKKSPVMWLRALKNPLKSLPKSAPSQSQFLVLAKSS